MERIMKPTPSILVNFKVVIFTLILLIPILTFAQKTKDWTGNVDSDWNNAANWAGGTLPTGSSNIEIDPSNYTGAAASPIISTNSTFSNKKCFVQNGAVLTIQANLSQSDKFTVTGASTTVNMTAGTLTITGIKDIAVDNDATFNLTGGSVISGKVLNIDLGGTFNMSGASTTLSVATDLEIRNELTSYSSFNLIDGTVTISGNVVLDGGGTASATPTLNISGGTFNVNTDIIWTDNSPTVDQPHLLISGGTTTIVGDVHRSASNTSKIDIDISAGSLIFQGALTMDDTLDRVDQSGGSIYFDNTNNITNAGNFSVISGVTIFNGNSTLLNASGLWQLNNIIINNTSTLNQSTATNINIGGNWLNNGTFTANTNTVTFNGASTQSITSNSNNFYNLVIENLGDGITLNDDLTASNTITLTDGIVSTGSNMMVCLNTNDTSIVGYSNTSFVNGTLRRYVTSNSSIYEFPIGNSNSPTGYFRADVEQNLLIGVSYITASFGALTNHDDADLTAIDAFLSYSSVNVQGTWTITPNLQPSGGSYNIYLYVENFSGLTDNEFAPLKRPDGSLSAADWTDAGGTLNPDNGLGRKVTDGYTLRSGLTSFSEFGVGEGEAGSGLPIELIYFDAKLEKDFVQFFWATSTEINNEFFTIERSKDAVNFEPIIDIDGAGNSTVVIEYNERDSKPLIGVSYYRLKQTDYDGQFAFSDIVSINNKYKVDYQILPNPVKEGVIYVQTNDLPERNEVIDVQISDAQGRIVLHDNYPFNKSQKINLNANSSLKPGYYTVIITSGVTKQYKRILVL